MAPMASIEDFMLIFQSEKKKASYVKRAKIQFYRVRGAEKSLKT